MNIDVYYKLEDILNKWGGKIFGQICQDLLALSFAEMGCNPASIEVHNIEGVDIVIDDTNFGKYAIEVKTTSKDTINFGEKDHNGLKKFSQRGYISILAVLRLDIMKEWIFANAKKLKPKSNLSVNSLYTDEAFMKKCNSINENFEKLVKENYEGIFKKGEKYLKEKLKEKNIKYSGGKE
jgi:Holliday junction resolvase